MSEALKVLLAAMAAFNAIAPSAAQLIAILRKQDGTEIPLIDMIDGVVKKNDDNIAFATEYLETHPEQGS